MKKKLFISGSLVVLGLLLNALSPVAALAEDLSPSEVYYRDNIAKYEIAAKAPELKKEESLDPGGSFVGGGGFVGSRNSNSTRSSSGRSSQSSSRNSSGYTSSDSNGRSSSGRVSAGRR